MAAENRTEPGLRDRFRAQVRQEVKTAALRQLAEGGPEALSLNAIAKQVGMTGPALYRYFTNRDSLLTELVIDAYGDLASALARAADAGATDAVARLTAVVRAFRTWALTEPHRYRLLFRAPLQGYDAQSTNLVEASQPAMTVVLEVVGALAKPDTAVPEGPAAQFREWMKRHGIEDVPEAVAARTTMLWAHLHGLVSLEIEGNFSSMGIDPATLYETEVKDFVRSL
ncbi:MULTISPECIES: TetR/AcrR family transcriptional regulator [unclassified Streptomyces]|uniref:TetR/AcrR family transcriptional regulator n=1 Tax=unclassified Streptomyces TaxID=2593676 RepID=UPI002E805077|nr:TetR/AcrR family transcriptional regulator [Streptomyces sp. NBC_00589]WTI41529.1 TetR/AcrR family transcriptional regulator [Streptomyces sp. NBC_00775]WUB24788.1 TetR/AcrR family transcriptional regulator [Streptomyces sp. NBC_00589]